MLPNDRAAVVVPLSPPWMVLHDVAGVDVDRLHVAVARHQPGVAGLAAVQAAVVLEHDLDGLAQGGYGAEDDVSNLPVVLDHEVVAGALVLEASSLSG